MAVNTRNTCQDQSQLELETAGGVVQILDRNTEGRDVLTQEGGPEAGWTREARAEAQVAWLLGAWSGPAQHSGVCKGEGRPQ